MKNIKPLTVLLLVLCTACLILAGFCLVWAGEIYRAASDFPWYKRAGAGALLVLLVFLVLRDIYRGVTASDENQRSRSKLIITARFERGGIVDTYFKRRGIEMHADMADFVERAAGSEASDWIEKHE